VVVVSAIKVNRQDVRQLLGYSQPPNPAPTIRRVVSYSLSSLLSSNTLQTPSLTTGQFRLNRKSSSEDVDCRMAE